uniref:C2H2-type domain-containing protein n=1 Tax=viral metagenome TaxID=1070528 RepID=A0A6C0I972_9ZZZZ
MTEDDKNVAKSSEFFYCKICDYKTYKQSNYDKHLLTSKHKKSYTELHKVSDIEENSQTFKCECGRIYKYRQGLWKHKKNCEIANAVDKEEKESEKDKELDTHLENHLEKDLEKDLENDLDKTTEKEILLMFMKEMKSTMIEMFKHMQPVNNNTMSNNIHNNSHNKTFNLQFFLNEQCKDALNINEFVNSIKIQLSDLEDTGRLGYVDGISKIIMKNLQDVDKFKRPIHCSDLKREVIYIKTNDTWTKDDENNEQMKNAIRQVTNKNIREIAAWAAAHPNCRDPRSRKNDQYLQIVSNSMSGISSEEQSKNIMQIIRNVAREVVIEK